MKKIRTPKVVLAAAAATALLIGAAPPLTAEEAHDAHASGSKGQIHISAGLKDILNQEMRGIEGGMQEILPALSAGDWATISRVASTIKRSYILKQKLTAAQKKELHASLPAQFIEFDHYFHATAGKLAAAAEKRDIELVNFYYGKMHEKCAQCHARYAAGRFPGLAADR